MDIVAPSDAPLATAKEILAGIDPPRDGKEERPGVVGHCFIEEAGGVTDHDPGLGRSGEIDAVEPHAPARHDLEVGDVGGGEERRVVGIGAGEDGIVAVKGLGQRGTIERPERLRHGHGAASGTEKLVRLRPGVKRRPGSEEHLPGLIGCHSDRM